MQLHKLVLIIGRAVRGKQVEKTSRSVANSALHAAVPADFQDELEVSLKLLQKKLRSLEKVHQTSDEMFTRVKVSCDSVINT